MHLRVSFLDVVHVVGGDDLDADFPRNLNELRIGVPLFLDPVVLNFDIEVTRLEHVPHADRSSFRPIIVVLQEELRKFPRETGRETDDALGVLGKQFHVDARLIVKPFGIGEAVQLDDVLIPHLVLCEQNKVVIVGLALFVVHVPANIEFTPVNGFDSVFFGLEIELDRAVHTAVVGHRDRLHALFLAGGKEAVDSRRPVQQTIFGMQMQVYKVFHETSFFRSKSFESKFRRTLFT